MLDHFLLNQKPARDLLQRVFASLLDPLLGVEELAEFISTDDVQHVDGVRLDYVGFIEHAQVLKKYLERRSYGHRATALRGQHHCRCSYRACPQA